MPTDLEREREALAAERREREVAELAKITEQNRLQQRRDARKSEIEAAEAALVELKRRNAEEDADDKRIAAAAEKASAAEDARHHAAVTPSPVAPPLHPPTKPAR